MTDNTDYIDRLNKLSLLDPIDISETVKFNTVVKFAELKEKNPSWNNKQICQSLGISSSTLNRIRNDLGVPSFYRYKVPLRRTSNRPKKEYDPNKPKKARTTKASKKSIAAGAPTGLDALKEAILAQPLEEENTIEAGLPQ